jgi:hypothetical protein
MTILKYECLWPLHSQGERETNCHQMMKFECKNGER